MKKNKPSHQILTNLKTLKIGIICGEQSGDYLGADLMFNLKRIHPNIKFLGLGGKKMNKVGMISLAKMDILAIMGFSQVIKKLPILLKLRTKVINYFIAEKIDCFIGIDAPDFNFAIERKLKKYNIKVFHYVGPSVFAWRENRLARLQKFLDGILLLFPFEIKYYKKYKIQHKFVGHPLAVTVKNNYLKQTKAKLLGKLNMPDNKYLAVLPGSRKTEIDIMWHIYLQVIKLTYNKYPNLQFIVPVVNENFLENMQKIARSYLDPVCYKKLHLKVLNNKCNSTDIISVADYALITSGTAALEAALLKKPMVIAIKVGKINYHIMRLMRQSQWLSLPNFFANKMMVPEFIQNDAKPSKIFAELSNIIANKETQQRQLKLFEQIHQELDCNSGKLAAKQLIKWLN